MHVSVAIVGFRNATDVERCLGALAESVHVDFDVVICENGGQAAYEALTETVAATLPGGQPIEIILAAENLGFAAGVNVCLNARPGADAWWVLNPDTAPAPDALAIKVARLASGDCDAVGCVLYLPNGRVQSYGGLWRGFLARAESLGIGRPLEEPVDTAEIERAQNYLNGAAMLVGRRFVETAGPMREDYFLYCEEVEWCLRALALGMRLGFAREARVLHVQGTTTGAGGDPRRRPRLPVYLGERNRILLTRDCWSQRLWIAAPAAMALHVIRCVRHRAWPQLTYGLAGVWAGLRDQRGRPEWNL